MSLPGLLYPGAYEHGQITKVKHQRPSAEFRDIWQYNNNMYMILSYLPTVLLPSKIPFARYAKEHILDPLGMISTTYSSQVAAASGQLADGMARQVINAGDEKVIFRALPYWFPSGEDGNRKSWVVSAAYAAHSVTVIVYSGPGGVISNAVDMVLRQSYHNSLWH